MGKQKKKKTEIAKDKKQMLNQMTSINFASFFKKMGKKYTELGWKLWEVQRD